jgi:RNA polymerase-binding transcription factor DksA
LSEKIIQQKKEKIMREKKCWLTEDQKEYFKIRLKQEQEKVLDEKSVLQKALLEKIRNPSCSILSHPADLTSLSTAVEKQKLENCQKQLRAIHKAMLRLANGDYGNCAACQEPINPQRIEAVPATSHCANCKIEQKKTEKKLYPAKTAVAFVQIGAN